MLELVLFCDNLYRTRIFFGDSEFIIQEFDFSLLKGPNSYDFHDSAFHHDVSEVGNTYSFLFTLTISFLSATK